MAKSKHPDVLGRLTKQGEGWVAPVPERYGTFLGRPLGLKITTYEMRPFADPAPPPTAAELDLAEFILDNLPAVLGEAERRFVEYTEQMLHDAAAVGHVTAPIIWMDRGFQARDGASGWTLVVHRDDWPCFGYHIEFDGLRHVKTWSGD